MFLVTEVEIGQRQSQMEGSLSSYEPRVPKGNITVD